MSGMCGFCVNNDGEHTDNNIKRTTATPTAAPTAMREKSRADLLLDYLFPPACVCCGALIPPDGAQDCFCERCYERLRRESVPRFRRIEIGNRQVSVLTAMAFAAVPDCPCRALILSMKNIRSSRSAYFSARRLYSVLHMLPLGESTVIAYVPRSRSGRRRYGFDQMDAVARKLSRMTGMAVLPCLKNGSESIQKGLSAEQRVRTVRGKYTVSPRYAECVRGTDILLIDDVCTTGASVYECTRVLFEAGCAHVFPLCIADASRDRFDS